MNKTIPALLLVACLAATGCTSTPPSPSASSPAPVGSKGTPANASTARGAAFVQVPLGLDPDLQVPADNPLTSEKVELGRILYFDKRLSADGTVSCATCHDPAKGWTDNLPVSAGIRGQKGTRSAPTVINSTYSTTQFWDGRAKTLEEQALGPVANPVEMGNTLEKMVETIQGIKGYAPLFEKAFGGPVTKERVGMAIASFERTVLSGNSRYDRYQAGDKLALSDSEKRGMDLFNGKAKCVLCHSGKTFSDNKFHNLGVGVSAAKPDLGRSAISKNDKEKGAFRTPGLRDISRTGPYMHDGSEKSLESVVDLYNRGGNANPTLDPLVGKLGLTDAEKTDLVAFMKALDGEPTPTATAPEMPR